MGGEAETEQEQEGGDDGENSAGGDGFAAKWGWVANVDAVAETCRCDWDKVWQMTITEFLNLLSYRKDKVEESKRQMEQWKRTH